MAGNKLITLFGWGLIISSLIHMQKLAVAREWYFSIYSDLGPVVYLRYAFSWLQRLVGISIGAGLLYRNNWARIGGICLGMFTAVTVYWKHPYAAFLKHNQNMDREFGGIFSKLNLPTVSFEALTVPAILFHCFIDVSFWAFFIFFVTRPQTKALFVGKKR